MKAYIIRTNLTSDVVEFEKGESYALLSGAVGGYIECVGLRGDLDMWVNEEGKLQGLPLNPIGTRIWSVFYGPTDTIVGDVIFTGGVDENGETLGLTDETLHKLQWFYETAIEMLQHHLRDLFEGV